MQIIAYMSLLDYKLQCGSNIEIVGAESEYLGQSYKKQYT